MAAVLAALISVPGAESSLSAVVTNTKNQVATAIFPNTCATVAGASGAAAYLAYPFNDTSGPTAADVSGNNRPGTYTSGGVTYGAAGPCPRDGGRAITLDGSTGYVSGPNVAINPQIFSIEIWFKTTVGGGKLIGLGNQRTGSSTQYDRQIFLSNSGTVTFGVFSLVAVTITSPSTYLDGRWHNVIATLAPLVNANPGMRLYIDGALVASNLSILGADVYSGYWRIGYDNISGWGSNQPTNFFFTGSLAFASTYTYAFTAAQVTAQYNAGI